MNADINSIVDTVWHRLKKLSVSIAIIKKILFILINWIIILKKLLKNITKNDIIKKHYHAVNNLYGKRSRKL